MDPITLLVTALVVGAAAGLKPTAEKAVKDAYAGVKTLIQRKYGDVDLSGLERKPESKTKQDSVAEDLSDSGAGQDQELLDKAKQLLDVVKERDQQVALGIDFEEIEAAYFKAKCIAATGTGVKVKKGKFEGGIDIENVTAGIPTEKK